MVQEERYSRRHGQHEPRVSAAHVAGKAVVAQPYDALAVQQHICGLDVAVYHLEAGGGYGRGVRVKPTMQAVWVLV